MIRWIEHNWTEEHSSPEDGPSPHDLDEYDGQDAVEVVNGKASVVMVLEHHEAFISGEGSVHLHELKTARRWLDALADIKQQLSAFQDQHLYMHEEYDLVGPYLAAENAVLREAAELAVKDNAEPSITTGCGFALLKTFLGGIRCAAVWDTEKGGEFVGFIREGKQGWAALDVWQAAMDNDFEYFFDREEDAAKSLRTTMANRSLEELRDAIVGGSLLISR